MQTADFKILIKIFTGKRRISSTTGAEKTGYPYKGDCSLTSTFCAIQNSAQKYSDLNV